MRKHSFTLIELLIVLVIIGVVVTLAVPQYQLLVIRSRGAEAKQMLSAFADSVWRFYVETGDFPDSASLISPSPPPPNIDTRIPPATKYFSYAYLHARDHSVGGPTMHVYMFALDNDALRNGPNGAITKYRILYDDNPDNKPGSQPQKMDEKWYKFFSHSVKDGATERGMWYWP